jgi:hypothetical protein
MFFPALKGLFYFSVHLGYSRFNIVFIMQTEFFLSLLLLRKLRDINCIYYFIYYFIITIIIITIAPLYYYYFISQCT